MPAVVSRVRAGRGVEDTAREKGAVHRKWPAALPATMWNQHCDVSIYFAFFFFADLISSSLHFYSYFYFSFLFLFFFILFLSLFFSFFFSFFII